MRSARRDALILFAVALVLPQRAAAHNPLPGLDGFYSGLWHPLSTPDQALGLVTTGFLLGTFAFSSLLPPFGMLALGVLGGMIIGLSEVDIAPWLLALASFAAAWAALMPGRGRSAAAGLVLAMGFCLGSASVPGEGAQSDRLITMAGSFLGIMLSVFYLAGALDFLREKVEAEWFGIALRILAAWAAALSIVMLALLWSGAELSAAEWQVAQ